ncbi:MAG: hypothetical protein EA405_05735 [Rhodospirillales bacterium]|nr:MAG: hypothetical protein EA405_05735 [Rhodospirillales bacterium]
MATADVLLALTLVAVAAVLLTGLLAFASGSDKWSNVLMRVRVIAQGAALAFLALLIYFSR